MTIAYTVILGPAVCFPSVCLDMIGYCLKSVFFQTANVLFGLLYSIGFIELGVVCLLLSVFVCAKSFSIDIS